MTTAPAIMRSFEVRNFRMLRSVTLKVHPEITVLVGLNDVGKTSLLQAIYLYGLIQKAGFRGPLSDDRFTTTGDEVTQLIAVWEVAGKEWTHRIVLDADNPEERLESEGRFWSWNPKECRLTTEQGEHEAERITRYQTLARIDDTAWKLDTDIDESVYKLLDVTQYFATPPAYLFEPSMLGRPAPLDVHEPRRNGFGWAVWLQEIINRRNDDLSQIEASIRQLFPFFGRVRVREERFRIEKDVSVLGPHDASGSSRAMEVMEVSEHDERARLPSALTVSDLLYKQSKREVFIELNPDPSDGEAGRIDASDVSSGLLLALAHFALIYADGSGRLVLLEEPENGLNAKITLEMMRAFLYAVRARGKQLVLTTHNGWWLDLVPKESIRILTRDAEGAHIQAPDPDALDRWRDENDVYPSELMSVYGPEGLLASPGVEGTKP